MCARCQRAGVRAVDDFSFVEDHLFAVLFLVGCPVFLFRCFFWELLVSEIVAVESPTLEESQVFEDQFQGLSWEGGRDLRNDLARLIKVAVRVSRVLSFQGWWANWPVVIAV